MKKEGVVFVKENAILDEEKAVFDKENAIFDEERPVLDKEKPLLEEEKPVFDKEDAVLNRTFWPLRLVTDIQASSPPNALGIPDAFFLPVGFQLYLLPTYRNCHPRRYGNL